MIRPPTSASRRRRRRRCRGVFVVAATTGGSLPPSGSSRFSAPSACSGSPSSGETSGFSAIGKGTHTETNQKIGRGAGSATVSTGGAPRLKSGPSRAAEGHRHRRPTTGTEIAFVGRRRRSSACLTGGAERGVREYLEPFRGNRLLASFAAPGRSPKRLILFGFQRAGLQSRRTTMATGQTRQQPCEQGIDQLRRRLLFTPQLPLATEQADLLGESQNPLVRAFGAAEQQGWGGHTRALYRGIGGPPMAALRCLTKNFVVKRSAGRLTQ